MFASRGGWGRRRGRVENEGYGPFIRTTEAAWIAHLWERDGVWKRGR
jgi:hypothetical protein